MAACDRSIPNVNPRGWVCGSREPLRKPYQYVSGIEVDFPYHYRNGTLKSFEGFGGGYVMFSVGCTLIDTTKGRVVGCGLIVQYVGNQSLEFFRNKFFPTMHDSSMTTN